jgi:opacity protein-like surface antigen
LDSAENFFAVGDGFLFRIGANWRLWNQSGEETPYGVRPDYLPVVGEPYDWSGFHVGPHVGFGSADTGGVYAGDRMTNPLTLDPSQSAAINLTFDNRGLLAGGQAGFDWQRGSLVYGIDADVSAVDWDDVLTDFQAHGAIDPLTLHLDLDLLTTLRGRVGWAFNDMLLYLTGGLGILHGEFRDAGGNLIPPLPDGGSTAPDSKDLLAVGGVAGAGIEWGIAPNLSVRAEGLYLGFSEAIDLSDLSGVGDPGDRLDIGDSFAFRLGANWRPWGAGAGEPAGIVAMNGEPAAPYAWNGIYAGPHLGWGGLTTDGIYNPAGEELGIANEAIDLTGVNDLGLVGGGQIGFNWQRDSFVLGVEGDVAAVDWDGSESEFANPGDVMQFNSDVLATLRGRVGWAQDDLLFYVTGGLAFNSAELDNTRNDGGRVKNLDALGGVAGLGMEWGVTRNLSLKTEGMFLTFADETSIEDIGSEGDRGNFFLIDDGFVARLGANWRFNPLR